MGFLDKFLKKKTETPASKQENAPEGPMAEPANKKVPSREEPEADIKRPQTEEYTPGGSPVYRYEDHQEEGFRPPADVGVYAKLVQEHFDQLFPNRGHFVYHETLSDIVHVDVHILRPTAEQNFYVLYTTGMSDLPMTLPEGLEDRDDLKYAELFLFLPGSWNVGEDLEGPEKLPHESYWPIHMLKFLARFPHEYHTWLGFGHTMPNGPDYAPVCDGVGFGGMVLDWLGKDFGQVETPAGHDVMLYFVIPAYKEEIEYKLKYGMEGLTDRFQEKELPLILDPHRHNFCADFTEVLD